MTLGTLLCVDDVPIGGNEGEETPVALNGCGDGEVSLRLLESGSKSAVSLGDIDSSIDLSSFPVPEMNIGDCCVDANGISIGS
ncbi:hypothetical protein WICPIJ_007926 [Wickerhamomyces pijperi]|uniref:Uncharacterized protein n=1 Tax=Wickerhamomyces pijperi TaxID=599730 RepID=A0A9P8TJH3_WICPI|nr:hypothetical protein WICPIJ_007926 [Wickerhamomyces pijperi]